ncbi:MAG: hypothetical protein ACREJM_03275, partial [Candidatus Saccharimonadales bacterium]
MPVDASWKEYHNATIGLSVRYPSTWQFVEAAQPPVYAGVAFYPPGSDSRTPSPAITFDFAVTRAYDPNPTPSSSETTSRSITVGGLDGRAFSDSRYAIPSEGYHVELPYRGGTLRISATEG